MQRILAPVLVLLVICAAAPVSAQDFRITDARAEAGSRFVVRFLGSTNFYYILLRGDTPQSITEPVAIVLGQADSGILVHGIKTPSGFYRVRLVPLDQPLDSDFDGIDDVYELRRSAFLNPLNPQDALADFDADGFTNFDEYRAGTDPADGTSAP